MAKKIRGRKRVPAFRWVTNGDARFRVTPAGVGIAIIVVDGDASATRDRQEFLEFLVEAAFGSLLVPRVAYNVVGRTPCGSWRYRVIADVRAIVTDGARVGAA